MAKRGRPKMTEDQEMLIDVRPKNEKEIIAKAKAYKAVVAERQSLSQDEVQLKGELLELIKAADLQPMEDGKIRFTVDGFTIIVTPRDMLVQVKSNDDEVPQD